MTYLTLFVRLSTVGGT